jgi:hypothetical protein
MAGPHTELKPDEEVEVGETEIARARHAMRERLREEGEGPMRPEIMEQAREVVTERRPPANPLAAWLFALSGWVALAGIAVFTILGFRLAFMIGDANPRTRFVDFMYDITGPLVYPFADMMRTRALDGGGVFEPATAIAMGVYLIAAILVVLMLWSLAPRRLAGHEIVVRRRRIVQQQ